MVMDIKDRFSKESLQIIKKYLEENNHEILDIVTTESITLK